MRDIKVYIDVLVAFDQDGRVQPVMFRWTDGRKYRIDRVLDIKSAAAMKVGGHGDRYTVRVNGQERYMFFERTTNISGTLVGRWFVEAQA